MKNLKISRNLIKIFSSSLASIIVFTSIAIILIINYSLNLADFGDYIKAGALIKDRINPYEQLMYANSPISAIFFYLVSWMLPFPILPIMVHSLNILGVLLFLNWYVGKRFNTLHVNLLAITLLLGVGRALFGNVQVTGITLGLLALAFRLDHKLKSSYFSLLLILIALEIKPQIVIPFLIFYIFKSEGIFKKITFLFFSALILHTIVEIYFGNNLHLTWLKKVVRFSNNSILPASYEISIWKAINQILEQQQFLRFISLFSIVFILILVAKYSKSNPEKAFFLALMFPIFNSYVHLYDYVGILLIAIKYVNLKKSESLFLILPFLFFFPLSTNLFLISMIIELLLISTIINNKGLFWISIGLVSCQIITYSFVFNLNQEIQMSIYLSLFTFFLSCYVYSNIFRTTVTDSNFKEV